MLSSVPPVSLSVRRIARALLAVLLLLPATARAAVQGNFIQRVSLPATLSSPVGVTNAGDGSGRLFIVQQRGQIRIWDGAQLLATPFLDLSSLVGPCGPSSCDERGLLGLAFHPDYETNGFFYVFYTRVSDGDIVLARYEVSSNPNVANLSSGTVLLIIEHSTHANHNGGQLAFGPDGYLYMATGDGGSGGDPDDNALNLNSLLGKILRLDVDGDDDFPADPNRNYAIPPTNPFAGATVGADEIWAFGLRNPWRFGFDRSTGDLYIGDVGQGTWEEVNHQSAASSGGENYGWDVLEGAHCFEDSPAGACNAFLNGTSVLPILEYNQTAADPGHCSVTGGYVFRNLPSHSLFGHYIYGDFCSGYIWRGIETSPDQWTSQLLFDLPFGLTSFGEGETGRLYLVRSGGAFEWLAPYTFQDVTPTHWAWAYVEAINEEGLTQGCDSTPRYCPGNLVNRAETAAFLVRALHGPGFTPPPATGIFADVPTTHWAAAYIEQLHNDGLTNGCATSPLRYCPGAALTRAETAVFLLRAKHGGGYTPPAADGSPFTDVPASDWAAPWIEQLYEEGISNGCDTSPLRYCPASSVNRAEMAVFLARTFGLPLP